MLPVLAIVLLTAPRVGVGADMERAYAEGKTAVDQGRWVSAADLMGQAIDSDPREKKRPLSGPYIPHFYLGLSAFELGDCDLAMRSLQKSRQYRVVLETNQLQKLVEIEKACGAKSRSLRQAQQEIDSGRRLVDRVETKTVDPLLADFWIQGIPSPILQLRDAKQALDRAEQLLEPGTGPRVSSDRNLQIRPLMDEQIASSAQMATQAIDRLQDLEMAAEVSKGEDAATRQSLLNEVLVLRMQAVNAWGTSSQRARVTTIGRDLKSEFERVTTLYLGDSEVTVVELQSVKTQLTNFIATLETLPPPRQRRGAPTPLRQAAEAYFAGQYDQVLALLEDVSFSERQAQAHFYLFRAAALYSLYLIGDQPDPELLSEAQSNVKSCLQTSSNLEPLAEAFSPRFIEFFREQVSPVGQRQ